MEVEFENKEARVKDLIDLFIVHLPSDVSQKYVFNVDFMDWLDDLGFFTAPASTKYHGAYEGGLYDHSRAVALKLLEITDDMDLRWQRDESPLIIGLFHDLCKCDQYKLVRDNPETIYQGDNGSIVQTLATYHYEYNDKLLLKGHGDKSIMLLSQFVTLTEEEMLCIRYHMGAYLKEDWDGFDLAIKKYENVLWTHAADQLASKRGV